MKAWVCLSWWCTVPSDTANDDSPPEHGTAIKGTAVVAYFGSGADDFSVYDSPTTSIRFVAIVIDTSSSLQRSSDIGMRH